MKTVQTYRGLALGVKFIVYALQFTYMLLMTMYLTKAKKCESVLTDMDKKFRVVALVFSWIALVVFGLLMVVVLMVGMAGGTVKQVTYYGGGKGGTASMLAQLLLEGLSLTYSLLMLKFLTDAQKCDVILPEQKTFRKVAVVITWISVVFSVISMLGTLTYYA